MFLVSCFYMNPPVKDKDPSVTDTDLFVRHIYPLKMYEHALSLQRSNLICSFNSDLFILDFLICELMFSKEIIVNVTI